MLYYHLIKILVVLGTTGNATNNSSNTKKIESLENCTIFTDFLCKFLQILKFFESPICVVAVGASSSLTQNINFFMQILVLLNHTT